MTNISNTPLVREQGKAPTRILFVSLWELGWKTWGAQLEHFSALHPGLEAVHLRVSRPKWLQALGRELPLVRRAVVSSKRGWEWQLRRTVVPVIETGRFDCVLISSQILAPALLEPCQRAGAKMAVVMDVTGPAYQRDLLGHTVPPEQTWADERAIYDAMQLCVPMSSWIAESLRSDFSVPPERIHIASPSVETALFARGFSSAPTGMAQGGWLPRLLFCGNDFERKGGSQLVRWHQELWSEKAELHLASAHAPTSLSGLKNVFRHGAVPRERLLGELLPSSDVFCLPTQNDMSPFAVAEAQAAGLPTVSSRIGGLSDLVTEQSGFLCARDDEAAFKAAISRLIADPDLRAQMGAAARAHAEQHLDAAKVFPALLNRLIGLA